MKITCFILSILFLTSAVIKSQTSAFNFDNDQHVYWFFVKADIKTDKELKKPVYVIRRLGKNIKSGSFGENIEKNFGVI